MEWIVSLVFLFLQVRLMVVFRMWRKAIEEGDVTDMGRFYHSFARTFFMFSVWKDWTKFRIMPDYINEFVKKI